MKSIVLSRSKADRQQDHLLTSCASTKLLPSQSATNLDDLQQTQITFMNSSLENEVKCYDWRVKTEFPIVRIYDYKIVKKDCLKTVLTVRYEHYPITLAQMKEIPLFKILYLLKEAIIGFERLYDKFGPFAITAKMVALNRHSKCKIWLNENYASNAFTPIQATQTQFLQSISRLFIQICNKLKNTASFFKELLQFQTFCQALAFIQNYARENKINIQNSCKITQKELSIIENKSMSSFDPSLTMSRSPKFLCSPGLRTSLKPAAKINYLNLATSKMIKEGEGEECANMKTSGDTAADLFASKSIKEEKDHVDDSIIFGSGRMEQKKMEWQNKFNKSDSKYIKIGRCFSPKQEIGQSFFSPKHARKYDESFLSPNSKTQHRLSKHDSECYPEQQDILSQSVAKVFNKNNWEMTINGLFSIDQPLKKSSHHGKQKRTDDLSSFKLSLLGSVGKNINESFIHDEHAHPSTSEY